MSKGHTTPGPWTSKIDKYGAVVSTFPNPSRRNMEADDVIAYGGYLVCESICSQADAHLISAAPDMYAVLEELAADDYVRLKSDLWLKIHKALAKAEGAEVPALKKHGELPF